MGVLNLLTIFFCLFALHSVVVADPTSTDNEITLNDGNATDPYGDNDGPHTGRATYYYQDGVAGSCGHTHSDSDFVAALSLTYNGNNQKCGTKIKAKNLDNKKEITVTVVDKCVGCAAETVDLAIGPIKALNPNYVADGGIKQGRFQWHFE